MRNLCNEKDAWSYLGDRDCADNYNAKMAEFFLELFDTGQTKEFVYFITKPMYGGTMKGLVKCYNQTMSTEELKGFSEPMVMFYSGNFNV